MKSISIEQNASEVKLAFAVHSNSTLESIRLSSARLNSKPIESGIEYPLDVEFHYSSKKVEGPSGFLRIAVSLAFHGYDSKLKSLALPKASPAKSKHSGLSLECVYECDYALNPEFELTPEHVRAFKNGNAIFNVWPFFREFLQSSVLRMGYPPVTIPFLRLHPKPKASGGSANPQSANREKSQGI
jgi:hypothetical protein